ncbi:MAG: tetratricopeptide repeat protein [Candidatus Bruticola sp.]
MNCKNIKIMMAVSALLIWSGLWVIPNTAQGSSAETGDVSPFKALGGKSIFDSSWEFKQLFQEGLLLHRQGQLSRASDLYKKAYNLDKGRIEVLPYWGLVEYRLGNCEYALQLYNLYLDKEPNEDLVLFNKAVCLGRLERWEEVAKTIDLLVVSPLASSSEFLSLSGTSDYHRGNLDSAKVKLERALQLRKDNIGAALTLAAVYQKLADSEQACRVLRESLQVQPQSSLLLNNLGVINWQLGQSAEAEDYFKQAETTLNVACLNYAVCQVFIEGSDNVLSLAELTDKFPAHPLAELLYGIALYRAQRFSESRSSFIKVQELICELSSSDTAIDGNEFIKGRELDRLIEVNKKYAALTAAALGQTASALAYFQELYEANGAEVDTCHNLAVLYIKNGNYRQALKLAQQAKERLIDQADSDLQRHYLQYEHVYYCLVYLYNVLQDKEKAAQAKAEWKKLFPHRSLAEAADHL